MTITGEDVRSWAAGRFGPRSLLYRDGMIELRASSRHYYLHVLPDRLLGCRRSWDNIRLRKIEVRLDGPGCFEDLDNEIEPRSPEWPRGAVIGGVCEHLRAVYGHRSVAVDSLIDLEADEPQETLILTRPGRCYEAYLRGGRLILAAETWVKYQHISELKLAHPRSLDHIATAIDQLALDPVGDHPLASRGAGPHESG